MVLPYTVEPTNRKWIKAFIEQWHYSHSINGLRTRYCFRLLDEKPVLIGAALFGAPGMANVWKKYVTNEGDVVELHRLCCIDNTLKNTESFFVSRCLRWLKQNTDIKVVISYSDLEYGHEGAIYKAANFEFIGQTKDNKIIEYNGKRYHEKTVRTKYNNKLKPYAQELKNALIDGNAIIRNTKPKNIFLYNLV